MPESVVPKIKLNAIARRQRRRENIAAGWLLFADILALVSSFPLTAWLAAELSELLTGKPFMTGAWDTQRMLIFFSLSTTLLMWLVNKGHYRKRQDFPTEAHTIIKAVVVMILIDSFLLFALKYDFSRLWLVSNWLVAGLGLMIIRPLTKMILMKCKAWALSTIVIGEGDGALLVAEALRAQPYLGYDVSEIAVPAGGSLSEKAKSDATIIPFELNNLLQRLATEPVNYVVLATSSLSAQLAREIQQILTRARVPFAFAPAVHGLSLIGMEQQILFSHDVLLMAMRDNLAQPIARVTKTVFDYVLTLLGLAIIWPILFLLAVLIKVDDGGPILYRQRRVGYGGKTFDCFKFRSMAVDADDRLAMILESDPRAAAEWAQDHKLKSDPRITGIGKFLRKTSLDELPQLLNVLAGHMSLVGPRPITEAEVERYGNDIGFYYSVKPGLSGLWQVSGRNDLSYERRVELDGWYSRNWSLWLDIVILLKTPAVLLFPRGSY
ncbi:MAG TPA: undecaprenyl-phosphate galactose phosphotransferase WbaP [Alphaproteobacteria bacterium]|nr:undecaprenyl-phosphate galactose phosphotransferase WbaP [Alphaproteobacteria bacterium]